MLKKFKKDAVAALAVVVFSLSLQIGILLPQHAEAKFPVSDDNKWIDYDNYIVINDDVTWSSENVVYDDVYKQVVIVDGATVTIEKGTRVELLDLKVYYGRIVAQGTENEPVVFTKALPDYSEFTEDDKLHDMFCNSSPRGIITFDDWSYYDGNEPSIFSYVKFENLGSYDYDDPVVCAGNAGFNPFKSFFPTAYAQEVTPQLMRTNPAMEFINGNVKMEKVSFLNNRYADVVVNNGYYEGERKAALEITNSNFEGNTQNTALISSSISGQDEETHEDIHNQNIVILKNNWFGDSLGPCQASDCVYGGEKISGDYVLSSWRGKELIADPVIIIPGIMGSATEYAGGIGEMKLDPIMHVYDNMLLSFEENGYEEGMNLFEFPYEWRNSNVITAESLKDKIVEIKNKTGFSKVDIVAHSMGGLVARYYIESDPYGNDVDQLVTMGTPQGGSPKAYMKWEAGEGFDDFADKIIKAIFQAEAYHKTGSTNLKSYIQSDVESVQELLPDYDYLKDAITGNTQAKPSNPILDIINDPDNLLRLAAVRFTEVVGDIKDKENTVTGFRVVDSEVDDKWEHGMPENYYNPELTRGIRYGKGDETVPLESATGIPASEQPKIIDSTHGDLPNKAQCYVIEKLSGITNCNPVNSVERVVDILTFGIFSPIDVQIVYTDKDGNDYRIGRDFEHPGEIINEIDGAFYTGYDGVTNEFITIPNPENGGYKILTRGTEGTSPKKYRVQVVKISEDPQNSSQAIESEVNLTGFATLDSAEELKVEVEGNEVINANSDTVAPSITIVSPQDEEYLNNKTIDISYSVSDNVSETKNIKVETFLGGQVMESKATDPSLMSLGEHVIKIIATDEANNIQEKEITFLTTTNLQAIKDNVQKYYDAKLIKNQQQKNLFLASLGLIKQQLEFLEMIKHNPFIGKKAKSMLTLIVKNQVEQYVEFLIREIEQKQKFYDTKIKKLLIEDLQWLELNAVK